MLQIHPQARTTPAVRAEGHSQDIHNRPQSVVRLPAEFRFEGREVFVRRDPRTGVVVLSRKPDSWDGLTARIQCRTISWRHPTATSPQRDHDPFEGWKE